MLLPLTEDFFSFCIFIVSPLAVSVNFSAPGRVVCCVVWVCVATRRWLCFGVVCGMIGVSKKGQVIMMATATTTKATCKHHYYVACWNHGIGVTDSAGNPYVGFLVFDAANEADAYANDHAYEDGHSYAERVDARYAVRIMRRQLFAEMLDVLGIPLSWRDDVSELRARINGMGVNTLIGEYRVYCVR